LFCRSQILTIVDCIVAGGRHRIIRRGERAADPLSRLISRAPPVVTASRYRSVGRRSHATMLARSLASPRMPVVFRITIAIYRQRGGINRLPALFDDIASCCIVSRPQPKCHSLPRYRPRRLSARRCVDKIGSSYLFPQSVTNNTGERGFWTPTSDVERS